VIECTLRLEPCHANALFINFSGKPFPSRDDPQVNFARLSINWRRKCVSPVVISTQPLIADIVPPIVWLFKERFPIILDLANFLKLLTGELPRPDEAGVLACCCSFSFITQSFH
jgi:hypothetical protein